MRADHAFRKFRAVFQKQHGSEHKLNFDWTTGVIWIGWDGIAHLKFEAENIAIDWAPENCKTYKVDTEQLTTAFHTVVMSARRTTTWL